MLETPIAIIKEYLQNKVIGTDADLISSCIIYAVKIKKKEGLPCYLSQKPQSVPALLLAQGNVLVLDIKTKKATRI